MFDGLCFFFRFPIATSINPDEDFQLNQKKIIFYNYFSYKNNFDELIWIQTKPCSRNALANKQIIKHISFFIYCWWQDTFLCATSGIFCYTSTADKNVELIFLLATETF